MADHNTNTNRDIFIGIVVVVGTETEKNFNNNNNKIIIIIIIMNLTNLTIFLELRYLKISSNVSIKCHSANRTKSFVGIIFTILISVVLNSFMKNPLTTKSIW